MPTTVSINIQLIDIPADIDESCVLDSVREAVSEALHTPAVAQAVAAVLKKLTPKDHSVTFVAH